MSNAQAVITLDYEDGVWRYYQSGRCIARDKVQQFAKDKARNYLIRSTIDVAQWTMTDAAKEQLGISSS